MSELEKLKAENAELREKLEKTQAQHALSSALTQAFSVSRFIAERSKMPVDIVQSTFGKSFALEDGKLVARDKAGNRMYSRTRAGELATVDEALEQLIGAHEHRDAILRRPGESGGTREDAGASKSAISMTAQEKAAFIGKHGLDAWNKKVAADYKPADKLFGGTLPERTAAIAARFPELSK
jgi:hypothetical protein